MRVEDEADLWKKSGDPGLIRTADKLTAYVGGVRDMRAVHRWMKGSDLYGDAEQRLRLAFQLVRLLAGRKDHTAIQSWLSGLNPELGDRVPLRLMKENDLETVAPEIMGAARAFLVDGYGRIE